MASCTSPTTLAPPEPSTSTPTFNPASCPTYDRVPLFGSWTTKKCRDTRARLLAATSTVPTTGDCTILTGSWYDPYTNTTVTDASLLQIDHLVALKEAYESGAYTWTYAQRKAYANDSTLLIAASGSLNMAKGARDVAEWLPPENARAYCIQWAQVKRKYNLSADSLELEVLKRYVPAADLPARAPEVTCTGN